MILNSMIRRSCCFLKINNNFRRNIFATRKMARNNVSSFSHLIAVAQMTSTNNKEENFANVKKLVEKAASRGAQMTFLPEGCDYIGESKEQSLEMAEPESGVTLNRFCQLAGSLQMWLSVGGIHIKEENSSKISNTHFIIDNLGNVVGKYVKSHLFNVEIPERNVRLKESTYVQEGNSLSSPVQTPPGLISLGICYDLRFPEFSLLQRKAGAQVLTFPSAFTVPTGLAHWHSLLRARAIETQCYVVAAAQTAQHNKKRASYGHALIVDPWGTVVAEVSEGTNVAFAEVDLEYLEKVRKQMPVFSHRRADLYSLHDASQSAAPSLLELLPFPSDFVVFPFGQASLKGSDVFLRTVLSHAFVNRKPFSPGHVLVSPQKPVERLGGLNPRELSDFAQAIVMTLLVIIDKYSPVRTQIALQDGKWAGQTIHHAHAHVIPVTEKSSSLLERHEEKDTKEWRNDHDMAIEAADLREHTVNVQRNNTWLLSSNIPRTLQLEDPITKGTFSIGDLTLFHTSVLASTGKCFAFIPGNPVLPGHICVCPCDESSCLSKFPPGSVSDMFLLLQRIQKGVEDFFGVSSSTIFIKSSSEGKGICAHILPRKENDLPRNDDIYNLLLSYQIEPPLDTDNSDEFIVHLKSYFELQC